MKGLVSIRPGTQESDVLKILGEPQAKLGGGRTWVYWQRFRLGGSVVYVYFDHTGQYKSNYYDR